MKKKWSTELLKAEALKYKSKSEFRKNSPAAHSAAKKRADYDHICAHMLALHKSWTAEAIAAEALKYDNRATFKKNSSAYNSAVRLGILDEICSHMVVRWECKWDVESIYIEALKYTNRTDFMLLSSGAYAAAKRLGVFEKATEHMGEGYIKWNVDDIYNESLRYSSRDVFKKKSSKAYEAALNYGILDKACSHMRYTGNSSSSEKELLSAIRNKFPKAQKLVDRKANIADKSHIKGFDIDIYIPELRKGIEFDGIYYHSINGLKRGRPSWPQEDLENYHKIKDEYFRSKGIEILHIKEEEWLEDKEKCITMILSFLEMKEKS